VPEEDRGTLPNILPAPPETKRHTDIIGYEVQVVLEKPPQARVVAFNADDDEVATAELQFVSDSQVRVVFSENTTRVTEELEFARDASENTTNLRGRVDEHDFEITEKRGEGAFQEVRGERLSDMNKARMLAQWSQLADSMITLAEAMHAKEHNWSCTSCVVLGGAVAVGTPGCLETALNPDVCAGILAGAAVFLENCEGACHHLLE
jgi:hypothetical protein